MNRRDVLRQMGVGFGALSLNTLLAAEAAMEGGKFDAATNPILARGKRVFTAAGCIACHRVGNEGQTFGPDLTAMGDKGDAKHIVESLLEPNAIIAEGFAMNVIQLFGTCSPICHAVDGDVDLQINHIQLNSLRQVMIKSFRSRRGFSFCRNYVLTSNNIFHFDRIFRHRIPSRMEHEGRETFPLHATSKPYVDTTNSHRRVLNVDISPPTKQSPNLAKTLARKKEH